MLGGNLPQVLIDALRHCRPEAKEDAYAVAEEKRIPLLLAERKPERDESQIPICVGLHEMGFERTVIWCRIMIAVKVATRSLPRKYDQQGNSWQLLRPGL